MTQLSNAITDLTQTSGKNLCSSIQCPGIPNTLSQNTSLLEHHHHLDQQEVCEEMKRLRFLRTLTCAWCTWTSWGCLCIVCNRSGQRGERRIPARSRRSCEGTRKELRACLGPQEKLQFPEAAAHGTPVWNTFTSRSLEIWVLAKSRKGLPSARPLPEKFGSAWLHDWYRHRDITVSNKPFS